MYSGLLQCHNRRDDHLDEEIRQQTDDDHQYGSQVNIVKPVFSGIPGIVKNLLAAGAAPVGTLLADKSVAAFTGYFFRRKRRVHGFNSFLMYEIMMGLFDCFNYRISFPFSSNFLGSRALKYPDVSLIRRYRVHNPKRTTFSSA